MRLRLTVRRHKLPPADLLWAVPQDKAHEAFTIAQLLEQVNDIIPLENPHWGLEDYAVEIGNFEALHFQKVKDILKDEDHVCIRHLTQSELRARHIAGRDQINANGQHLIDGLPFGKSYFSLRRPYRPPINIPPLRSAVADATSEDALPGLLEGPPYLQENASEDSNDDAYVEEQPARKRRRVSSVKSDKSDKSVRFQEKQPLDALSSDEDTEDEYQASSDDDEVSSSSSSDISSDDSSSAASKQGDKRMTRIRSAEESISLTSGSDPSSSDSDSSSDTASSSDSSDSDPSSSDDDSSDSESEPEEISSKDVDSNKQNQPQTPIVAPYEGLERTKARNRRRRLGKLRRQMQGVSGENVTFEQADSTMQEDQGLTSTANEESIQETITESVSEVVPVATQQSMTEVTDTPPSKRSRIDVPSFRRLTMGSLGLRTPKNKEDEDKLRKKIAADANKRGKKKSWAKSPAQSQDEEPKDLEGEDAWMSRIDLKAFEVLDENVEHLTTPPFPFQQRWDPQQQYYESESKSKKNKKKRKRNNQDYDEQEDHYEDGYGMDDNGEWQVLNYDDEVEDGAQSQLLQETKDAQTMSGALPNADDFPPLPSDVTTLPKLATEDLCVDLIIVYKEMEVSASTGWQPRISDYRTAKVLEIEDGAAYLELAARDIPQKKDGKNDGRNEPRMFDITEDDDDPSKRWVEFPNVSEMWLLQPGPNTTAENDGMTDAHISEENSGEGMTDVHISDTKEEDSVAEY